MTVSPVPEDLRNVPVLAFVSVADTTAVDDVRIALEVDETGIGHRARVAHHEVARRR